MHYECTLCLTALNEAFCDCGGVVHPVTDSRRIPGVRSAAEIDRVLRIHGALAAQQLVGGDALLEALKPKTEPDW